MGIRMSLKAWVLVALAFCIFLAGAVGQYIRPGADSAPSDIWFMGPSALLIFLWYWLDTNERGYRRSVWLNFGVVALALFALPYYFFASRGAKQGSIALGLFVLALPASGLLVIAGQYAMYYAVQS